MELGMPALPIYNIIVSADCYKTLKVSILKGGLDVVNKSHWDNKNGKYIMFFVYGKRLDIAFKL